MPGEALLGGAWAGRLRQETDKAAAVLWTLASPETYDLLVLQRGWTTAEFAGWLADALAGSLLRADAR